MNKLHDRKCVSVCVVQASVLSDKELEGFAQLGNVM